MPDDFDSFVDDLLVHGESNPEPTPAETKRLLDELATEDHQRVPAWLRVILVTTSAVPGRRTISVKGVITSRFADRGGDFALMERECFKQLKKVAASKSANAVIGVSFHYGETNSPASGTFYALAIGTAVVVE